MDDAADDCVWQPVVRITPVLRDKIICGRHFECSTNLIAEGEIFVCEQVFPDLQLGDDKDRGGQCGREEEGKARCHEGLSVG